MKNLIYLLSLFFIAGCAGSPMAISMKSPEQLKAVPDDVLIIDSEDAL
ncbi:MAG: hypothetical protein JSW00_14270 [Thermoplasmata archaeon]|nr:MAG: hypothetical protein JSW00_14270 [Thermoplasmata archaeon]